MNMYHKHKNKSNKLNNEKKECIAYEYISKTYGEEYASKVSSSAKSGKKIQDAHEAIRPTDIGRTPAMLKDSLDRNQLRLYTLIWKRFVACRMKPSMK